MPRLLFFVFCILLVNVASAQICGTPQQTLLERVDFNRNLNLVIERGVLRYIPVTFHLVAKSDGTGRIQEEDVFRQLCSLNEQYADQSAFFYIDHLNYFDNTSVYETPSSSAATVQMRLRQDNNSLNVFITNKADNGGGTPGTVLAYYDPQEDWIVSRRGEINGATNTLAHEIGHFFSLPHPHAGWECKPYTTADYGNPVNMDFTLPCEGGGGSMAIELQNGSNCLTAADRICDTPPDYNIGFLHQNDCAPNTSVKDKNGQIITPITNNYMSYYSDCDSWVFTQTQKNLMNNDFFTPQRAYLRTNKVPELDSIEAPVIYITPIGGAITPGFTNILLDWEDTPGATNYLVMVDRFPNFTFDPQKYFVTESQLILDELPTNIVYHWRVWPYNETRTCAGYSPTQTFRVGTGVGVNEIGEINEYVLSPNPIASNGLTYLSLTSIENFEAELSISDATGHVFSRNTLLVPSGVSQHPVQTEDLPAGIYFVMLRSKSGILVERLVKMN